MKSAIRPSRLMATTLLAVASSHAIHIPTLISYMMALDRTASSAKPRRQSGTGSNAANRRAAEKRRQKSKARRQKRS